MPCISCFLKKPLLWISAVGLILASVFLGYGFSISSIILISILTLSTLIFYYFKLKSNPKTIEESVQERTISTQNLEPELVQDQALEEDDISESECRRRSSTSEDLEADYWQCGKGNIFLDNSDEDGSISDEDSLIEISLPSGVYIDQYQQEEKNKKLGDDLEFFKQQISLVELLAELNEENLIEIDLSIGSIKCIPRFEIQA